MNDTATLLRFFHTGHINRVKKLSHPLKDAFGIDTFWHSTIDKEGAFTHISNTPDGTYHYFEQKHYLNNPFLRHPSNYSDGFYLLSDLADPSYLESQKRHNDQFGLDHLLFLCKQVKERCHIFGFATTRKNLPMLTIYLNNIHLLHQFSEHYLEEISTLSLESFTISLPKLVGPSFFSTGNKILPGFNHSNLLNSQDLSLLSKREKECLKLFLNGQTAAETATQLNISRRTVESYFENIKDKLGCFSKRELFNRFKSIKF